MRTNSKFVRDAVQQYIINSIDTEDYDIPENLKDQLIFICSEFKRVAGYRNNIIRLKTYQNCFIDWYQGLPSYFNISVYNHEIVYELMPSFGLPQPEKKDDSQSIELFNYLIYSNFILLCKKNGVNFYDYCKF
jgi:hypothetical protein